jgi:hypothetical protein
MPEINECRAQVTSVDDPDQLMRVQVRIPELFPKDQISGRDLPWAEYRLPLGARFNEGGFVPCKIGDWVWVDFPYRNAIGMKETRRPRITGGAHFCPDGLPNLPHEAFDGPNGLNEQHQRPDDPDVEIPERATRNRTTVFSMFGLVLEVTSRGRLTITNKRAGSSIDLTSSGSLGFFSPKNIILYAKAKLKLLSDGEIKIDGKGKFEIGGDEISLTPKTLNVEVKGTSTLSATGMQKLKGAKVGISSTEGGIDLLSSESLRMQSNGLHQEKVIPEPTISPIYAFERSVEASGAELGASRILATGHHELTTSSTSLYYLRDAQWDAMKAFMGNMDDQMGYSIVHTHNSGTGVTTPPLNGTAEMTAKQIELQAMVAEIDSLHKANELLFWNAA